LSIDNIKPDASLPNLKSNITNILKVFKIILNDEKKPNSTNINYILLTAEQYLRYNLIKYPSGGDVPEKLNRILFLVTNFVDKYQACNCNTLYGRDMIFKYFKQVPTFRESFLILKKYSFFNEMNSTFNQITVNSSLNNHVLFNKFIEDFYNLQINLKLFWKGKLKQIKDIRDDLEKNFFNYFSIPKYVNVVVEWTTGVFSYTLLDLINGISENTAFDKTLNDKLNNIIDVALKYTLWPKRISIPLNAVNPESFKSDTVSIKNQKLMGLHTVLRYILKQNENVIQRQIGTRYQDLSSFDDKKFEKMIKDLETSSKNKKSNKYNSSVTIVQQPLQYNLSDYFLVNNFV